MLGNRNYTTADHVEDHYTDNLNDAPSLRRRARIRRFTEDAFDRVGFELQRELIENGGSLKHGDGLSLRYHWDSLVRRGGL